MTQAEIGKTIAALRKDAGYTQQSLADALNITDKAISKWERGVCAPDVGIISKLAVLLDTDLATLLPNVRAKSEWKGLLIFESEKTNANTLINNKPLLHYMLSYFMLLGITDIEIRNCDKKAILDMHFEQYGLNVSFEPLNAPKTMLVYGKFLLFGSYLSGQLKNIMNMDENVFLTVDDIKIPICFLHNGVANITTGIDVEKSRSLYRGMIYMPLDTPEQIKDADVFIRMYEKNHKVNFCDLKEIAIKRNIIECTKPMV